MPLPSRLSLLPLAVALLSACPAANPVPEHADVAAPRPDLPSSVPEPLGDSSVKPAPASDADAPGERRVRDPVAAESAPPASPRVADLPEAAALAGRIEGWFEDHAGSRGYLQVDKPLYKPGETIWFKAWDLGARGLAQHEGGAGLTVQLVSPKGSVVLEKRLEQKAGATSNDFLLPADVQGGEYTLKAIGQGGTVERPVIVSTYEPPRVKKKLEFLRKAYGEGDEVTATIEIKRPTGEAMAKKELAGAIRLDGQDLPRVKLTTNEDGGGLVRFTLPAKIATGDGLLTVLVEDGGVTESISKRIPIVLRKVQLGFFPEGGKLVSGLANRLYFEARNTLGKPADLEGRLVDDLGNAVVTFQTFKNGLGRVAFTPATGRTYHAEITRPVGVTEQYALPLPEADGCLVRTFDDPDGRESAIRVQVQCTEARRVVVSAMLRETPIDAAAVDVAPGAPAVVYLQSKDDQVTRAQGVARVTLFDDKLQPLAERVVFRNRRAGILLEVKPDKAGYAPRDTVSLAVTAADAAGRPLAAEFAVSVVDDTVISFADDKTSHLFSKLFLDPEMPRKVEEPNFYFDLTEAKSAPSMELLMGTWGYTQFAWREVKAVEPDAKKRQAIRAELAKKTAELTRLQEEKMERRGFAEGEEMVDAMPRRMAMAMPKGAVEKAQMAPPPMPAPPAAPRPMVPGPVAVMPKPMPAEMPMQRKQDLAVAGVRANRLGLNDRDAAGVGRGEIMADKDWAGEKQKKERVLEGWAPVRVFPVPVYMSGEFAGPRSDFRETVYWNPTVRTSADGKARVSFPVSDAVTSFRIFTEGVGGGLAGRDETVFKSSLPFSLSAKLPTEVSAGDRILMPVTLSNERDRTLDVTVAATFGDQVKLGEDPHAGGALAAGSRKSAFYPLDVVGVSGLASVRLRASTGSLSDELAREINVTPLGFPQQFTRSGQASGRVRHELDLGAAVAGTVEGTLTLYPSPVSTMVSGLEGMLRQPSGCFEQTSSTNYPNVMIMQYLKQHDVTDTALLEKSARLIDAGYARLAGYESPKKGYEWFGGDPGHEALTAYGLVEFADMKRVFGGVDDAMLGRTANWLKSRRDGKGGYQRDGKALDSFGRASPEVTDAYITWSLAVVGTPGLEKELDVQAEFAKTVSDAYRLGLAANALLLTPAHRSDGVAAARRLAGLQDATGAFSKADHSITRSGGTNLTVETTSLAVLALLEAGGHDAEVRKAVEWLTNNRGGFGEWGATQATVLALKAMTAYANASRKTRASGSLTVYVNGEVAGQAAYEAGRRDPLVIKGFGARLKAGKNVIEFDHKGDDGLPYSLAVEYRTAKPASSPDTVVALTTTIEKSAVRMGETVRVNAVVKNTTDKGQPMTLARVGIPGGLSFQTWQLKELREKGQIAFWETRAREVILYFRDLKPSEEKTIPIDLVATVPGSYTGPASSAYLYYNDEKKDWAPELKVDIAP